MGMRTPQEYIDSLKDGRVVYINREKLEDVTEPPILKVSRDWVAMDYVLNNDRNFQDLLTEVREDGQQVSFALMPQC